MVRIMNLLEKVKRVIGVDVDKQLHFIVGVVIAALMVVIGLGVYAAIATTVIGVAKEIYDGQHPEKHTKDWWDARYTAIPGIIVSLIYLANM